MNEKKIRNRLELGGFASAVIGGAICAYAARQGLDMTSLSSGARVVLTSGIAFGSALAIEVGAIKLTDKVMDFMKKRKANQRAEAILSEAKNNPDKFKVIEINRDLLSHMRESFKSKDSCMEIEAYGKNNTYLHIWSSSCKVIDDPEKDKISIVVSVDNSTSAKLTMNSDKSYLVDLVDKPTMEISMENMEDKNLFVSKIDSLVKGFHRAEFPSDKSIPSSNFLSPVEQENISKKEPFFLSDKGKDNSNTVSLKIPKDNEKGKSNEILGDFSK